MISSYFLGMILGFSVCLPVGPINTLMLSYATRSAITALAIGLGAASCDTIYLLFAGYFSSLLTGQIAEIFAICGALIMLYMAYGIATHEVAASEPDAPLQPGRLAAQFAKGFAINGLNPYVITFWLGMAQKVALDDFPRVFTAGMISACFIWVVALCYVVSRFAHLLRPRILRWINYISALIVAAFALNIALNTQLFAWAKELL